MPKTKNPSKLIIFLVSFKNAVILLSGGLGMIFTTIFLSSRVSIDSPYPVNTILAVGFAIVGFSLGVLISNAGLWAINKFYQERLESQETNSEDELIEDYLYQSNFTSSYNPDSTHSHSTEISRTDESSEIEVTEKKDQKSVEKFNPLFILAPIFLIVLFSFISYFVYTSYYDNQVSANLNTNQISISNTQNENPQQKAEESINKAIENKPEELKAALREYSKTSVDINEILLDKLEDKNIGGAIAVAITNWQFNKDKKTFRSPEGLGFQKITNDASLVRRAIKGEVKIDSVQIKHTGNKQFLVTIKVTNLTEKPLKCLVQKGQIFEIKDKYLSEYYQKSNGSKKAEGPQNVAKADEYKNEDERKYIIPPRDEKTIEFIAFCINKNLSIPDGYANITIYELKDKFFDTPDSLHKKMLSINKS